MVNTAEHRVVVLNTYSGTPFRYDRDPLDAVRVG